MTRLALLVLALCAACAMEFAFQSLYRKGYSAGYADGRNEATDMLVQFVPDSVLADSLREVPR